MIERDVLTQLASDAITDAITDAIIEYVNSEDTSTKVIGNVSKDEDGKVMKTDESRARKAKMMESIKELLGEGNE